MSHGPAIHQSPRPLESSVASPRVSESPDGTASHASYGGHSSDTPLNKVQFGPSGSSNFPPPKTDKPRPHICGTCGRSFARLEHLKRHERSHTKEKPFECPECTRCFARRDLLLRHQHKLHLTTKPASRPGKCSSESTANTGVNSSAKVRKSSAANGSWNGASSGSMRPRANTISHIDEATLGIIAGADHQAGSNGEYSLDFNYNGNLAKGLGMTAGARNHGNPRVIPKLATESLQVDRETSLRTAPPVPGMNQSFAFDQMNFTGSTINPAQLHPDDSMDSTTSNFTPFRNGTMEDDDNFDWLRGFNTHMNFNGTHDRSVGESSPSVTSHRSTGGVGDFMPDAPGSIAPPNGMMWQASLQPQDSSNTQFSRENGDSILEDLGLQTGTLRPPNLHSQMPAETYYPSPLRLSSVGSQSAVNGLTFQMQAPMALSSDGTSIPSSSMKDREGLKT